MGRYNTTTGKSWLAGKGILLGLLGLGADGRLPIGHGEKLAV